MYTLLLIATVLVILSILAISAYFTKKYFDNKATEAYTKDMEEDLVDLKDYYLQLKANNGRIVGQVYDYQIVWIGTADKDGKVINTYGSVFQMKQIEEILPSENRELQLIEEHLTDLRVFRETEMGIPEGAVTHVYPRVTVTQYASGTVRVGEDNKMRIVIMRKPDNSVSIQEVQVSVNFLKHKPEIYDWTDDAYKTAFKNTYRKGKGLSRHYAEELKLLNKIEENIKHYNDHISWFKFDKQGLIIGFVPPIESFDTSKTTEEKKDNLVEANNKIPKVS